MSNCGESAHLSYLVGLHCNECCKQKITDLKTHQFHNHIIHECIRLVEDKTHCTTQPLSSVLLLPEKTLVVIREGENIRVHVSDNGDLQSSPYHSKRKRIVPSNRKVLKRNDNSYVVLDLYDNLKFLEMNWNELIGYMSSSPAVSESSQELCPFSKTCEDMAIETVDVTNFRVVDSIHKMTIQEQQQSSNACATVPRDCDVSFSCSKSISRERKRRKRKAENSSGNVTSHKSMEYFLLSASLCNQRDIKALLNEIFFRACCCCRRDNKDMVHFVHEIVETDDTHIVCVDYVKNAYILMKPSSL